MKVNAITSKDIYTVYDITLDQNKLSSIYREMYQKNALSDELRDILVLLKLESPKAISQYVSWKNDDKTIEDSFLQEVGKQIEDAMEIVSIEHHLIQGIASCTESLRKLPGFSQLDEFLVMGESFQKIQKRSH